MPLVVWFYWSAVGILLVIQLWSDFLAIFRKQIPKSSSLSARLAYFLVWSLVFFFFFFLIRTVKGSSIRYTKYVFGQDFYCWNTAGVVLFNLWLRMINETGLCYCSCSQRMVGLNTWKLGFLTDLAHHVAELVDAAWAIFVPNVVTCSPISFRKLKESSCSRHEPLWHMLCLLHLYQK